MLSWKQSLFPNMSFSPLVVLVSIFALGIIEASTLQAAEIKSITPSFIKMRHAEKVVVEFDESIENINLSISPGGVYAQSVLDLPGGQTQIVVDKGLTWHHSGENNLDVYSPNLKADLAQMFSFKTDEKIDLFRIAQDNILTVENQKTVNIYSSNEPDKKRLQLTEQSNLIDANLSATHLCLVSDKIKLVTIKTQAITETIQPITVAIKSISPVENGCVTLLENGSVQLWAPHNGTLKLEDSYRPSSAAKKILIDRDKIIIANGVIGFTLLRIVSNKMHWAGSYNKLGNTIDIAIDGDDLLVADDRGILTLFDISQPDTPLLISDFPFKQPVTQLYLYKKKAYVVTESQLSIVNFKSQSSPLISTLGVNQGGSRRSFIEGDILYVADWFSGMHLYDITVPHSPRLLSSYHTPGSPKGVVVKNNIAYVADDDHGLQIVDVSNPLRPAFISSIPLKGLAYTMKLVDELLYVASHWGGFHILDVSDAKKPKLLGGFDTPSKSWALEFRDGLLYVADDSSGLMIFDVKNPQQPKLINQFTPGGMAEDIVLKGDKAYIAFFDNGLFILDISNPLALKQLAHLPTPGNARGIEIRDNFLYLASWEAGVIIVDIEKDATPKIVGQYDTRGATWGLSVKDKMVYAMDWWGGVKVIDATSETKPYLAGKYQTAGRVNDLIYSNNFIYTASGSRGMQVYDANNDLNPVWATGLDISGDAKQINIHADTAIIAAGDGGVVFVDISNPFQINWLSQITFNTSIDKIVSTEERVFALSDSGDLFVINYIKPSAPVLIKRVHGQFRALSLHGSNLFVLNNRQKLNVYDVNSLAINRLGRQIKLPAAATYFEISGDRLFAVHSNNSIAVYDIADSQLTLLSSVNIKGKINDLDIEEKQLLATNNRGELLVYKIHDAGQLEFVATYQSSHQLNRITTSKYGVFFSGEDIIASGKLLPELKIEQVGSNFNIQIPANMPLGTYHITTTQTDPHGSQFQSTKINAFKIGFPKLKSKFTMEDFNKKMKQGEFSGQIK